MHKIFRYPIFSETPKGSPTILFGTVRQKLWQKFVIQPPLLLSIRFFVARIFLKHIRVALRFFSVLWNKNFSIEISHMPFLCIRFFDTRFFLKHRRVALRFFWYFQTQILTKIVIRIPLLLFINFSDARSFLKHRRVALRNFSVLWETDFDKKSWYAPLFSYP